jgi:hypothetical protein
MDLYEIGCESMDALVKMVMSSEIHKILGIS